MLKGEFFSILKRGFSISSNMFTAFTIANLVFAFFQGELDVSHENILHNLVTIFVAIIAIVFTEKLKVNMWLRLLFAFIVINAILLGFTWLTRQLFRELPPNAYISAFISSSIIFVIVALTSWIAEYFKGRKENAK
ncbi:MAG: hypothetical protein FWE33_04395 [Defluviitaleaceae bacterium]|nr:hypothetical protein [Defluviitaleaceae bacterium]